MIHLVVPTCVLIYYSSCSGTNNSSSSSTTKKTKIHDKLREESNNSWDKIYEIDLKQRIGVKIKDECTRIAVIEFRPCHTSSPIVGHVNHTNPKQLVCT